MMRHDLLLTLTLSTAVMAAAHAAPPDTSDWACEYCPFDDGYRADYAVGVTTVDEDSAYFGNATGYDEEGTYANLDGDGSYANDGLRLNWLAEDLGLDSRAVAVAGGRQGSYGLALGYRELPRRTFYTTDTVFAQSADDFLALPSGWVNGATTGAMTELDASLVSRNIESDRSVFDLGASFLPSDSWRIWADFRRQEHDGTKIFGGPGFATSALLPMPFDYETDEIDVGVRYTGERGFLALGWYLSEFENTNTALSWEQPFAVDPVLGNDTFASAQAPDNEAHQVSLQAGYSFPEQRTVVSLSAAVGEIEQDESLLPYTVTSSISTSPLPRSSLDGSIDTTNFAFAVSSKAIDKTRIKFSYRYDERDNQTSQDLWNRVITDTFPTLELEANIPYSFERSSLSLSADYDLFDTVRISGGYDRKEIERDFQEVAEQTEDIGWGRLRWQPTPALELDVRGGTSERDIDRFDESALIAFGQNPLMQKYNLAYRYREFADIELSFASDTVAVTLETAYADDDYTDSEIGITSGEELRFAADLNWIISENASAYLTAGLEDIESDQAGSELFAAPDWTASHDDDFTTVGIGFQVRNIAENIDLQLDYLRSDGESEIVLDSDISGVSEFPELETQLDYLRFTLTYRRSERLEIDLNLRYQSFEAEDWALEGVAPATISDVLSLGALPYDDEVFIVGIGFRYSAGASAE